MKDISIANASIIFRNFSGKASMYNNEGNRNFAVILDEETAAAMNDEGWNVKSRTNADGETYYYLQVAVNMHSDMPPKVYRIGATSKMLMTDSTISELDFATFKSINLIISPYKWELPNGVSGIKAYLKVGYFEVEEDLFWSKYEDIPTVN